MTEKLVYKSKLLALEQQTLNASMNRHFIFNALNSIQYYINTQDRLSANRYLTSFAKLIRKNLDSSINSSGLVTLTDEIERLELYISLEHMRFQEKFEYEVNVADSIDTESVKIPAMILQPFVENSIWHGILPQKEGGLIQVNITDTEAGILFEIVDNGIGYDVSQSKKTDNSHHSKGMLITNGRIDLLKKATEKKMSIKGPFQMNDENGNSLGTKVEILLETETLLTKKL
jgi:LytS/YehU family sensor histidine kinase